jgi:hypothetical protein
LTALKNLARPANSHAAAGDQSIIVMLGEDGSKWANHSDALWQPADSDTAPADPAAWSSSLGAHQHHHDGRRNCSRFGLFRAAFRSQPGLATLGSTIATPMAVQQPEFDRLTAASRQAIESSFLGQHPVCSE